MNYEDLKLRGIDVSNDNITIYSNKVTLQFKENNQYLVFDSGEIIKLDKLYNIKFIKVSGEGNVGVILD